MSLVFRERANLANLSLEIPVVRVLVCRLCLEASGFLGCTVRRQRIPVLRRQASILEACLYTLLPRKHRGFPLVPVMCSPCEHGSSWMEGSTEFLQHRVWLDGWLDCAQQRGASHKGRLSCSG